MKLVIRCPNYHLNNIYLNKDFEYSDSNETSQLSIEMNSLGQLFIRYWCTECGREYIYEVASKFFES